MKGHPVFVYGTLRKGDCRFGLPTLINVQFEEAELRGFDLLSINGSFPGLVEGKGTVKGEIHVFKDFSELDQIEGYSEARDGGLYLRKKVTVSTPEGDMEASTYVFNQDPDAARARYRVIETGNWFDESAPRSRAGR